jgi:tRNA A58 N-methylase Trm61
MASTLSGSGQLTELATLELDRAFQEPVEYLAGSGGQYRAAQGVNIDAGELKLPSAAAVRLINAFKRQETIIMTVDLAVVLEAASLDGLELAFELGAGDATISFRK